MAEAGKRHVLLIYEHTLKIWYPATFLLSILLFTLWWFLPTIHPEKTQSDWKDTLLLFSASAAFLMTLFLFLARKAAYVRPYPKYLRLATPFFRLNISYKRILKTRSTEMSTLFPPSKLSTWQRESMAPLLRKTVIVVDLNAFPMSPFFLRLFLSPFFFKDKTPHFVFLVEDWMRFSIELESLRTGGDIVREKEKDDAGSILAAISRDK